MSPTDDKYWQHQLSPDEVKQLLLLLDQPREAPHNIRRFLDRFKQYAIARQINESVAHLSSRISRNGWIYGPSFAFLEWLAQTPVSQVGAVPRFAVVRWALGEDADLWLPLRGRVSRTSPCAWCGRNARNYPAGPAYGALCFACTGQQPGLPEPLSDDLLKSLSLHRHTEDKGLTGPNCIFPPIADKLLSAPGPAAQVAPIPCVLCQRGANSIDHWLSYCPAIYGAWLLLWKGVSPPIDWQSTPNRHTGVALCYLLFHARRLVTEYGGLRPSIECLKLRPLQRHVLDLWQRIYQSLPATLLQWFRAPPLHHDLPCTNTMHIRVRRFPQTQIDSALLPDRGLCTSRAFSKDEVIATFGSSDVRLRYLLTQYRRLPFPAATAALVGFAAQQLPRQVRLFLFGHSHCEIDISGAHYELTRRCCAHAGVHRSLAPIREIREWLKAVLVLPEQQVSPGEVDGLIKKWPLVIINSDSPREALAYLSHASFLVLPTLLQLNLRALPMNSMQLVGLLCTIHRHGALPEIVLGVELTLFGSLKPWSNNLPGLPTATCNR